MDYTYHAQSTYAMSGNSKSGAKEINERATMITCVRANTRDRRHLLVFDNGPVVFSHVAHPPRPPPFRDSATHGIAL